MISCQTDTSKKLGRPEFPNPCISNGDGTCFRDGVEFRTVNMECTESKHITTFQSYLLKIERDLVVCRKSSKKCKRQTKFRLEE